MVVDDKSNEKSDHVNNVLQHIVHYGKEVTDTKADISEQVLSVPYLNYTINKRDIVSCVSVCM